MKNYPQIYLQDESSSTLTRHLIKKTLTVTLMPLMLASPSMLLAENNGTVNSIHKFWTCAISSYHSLVYGKYHEAKCQANTEYSEPPCREFIVEYEGINGIRPNSPFEQKTSSKPFDKLANAKLPTFIKIEISKDNDQYLYRHTIEQTGISTTNKWVYNGLCSYNEALTKEKIYMDYGLKTKQ